MNKALEQLVDLLETIPEESQRLLQSFLYEHLFHKKQNLGMRVSTVLGAIIDASILQVAEDPRAQLLAFPRNELNALLESAGKSGFRKNISLEKLADWCLENIAEDVPVICSEAIAVTLNPDYTKTIRKVYTYLKRKYDVETCVDPDTGEMSSTPYGVTFVGTTNIVGETIERTVEMKYPDDDITRLLTKHGHNRCTNGI